MRDPDADRAAAVRRLATGPRLSHRLAALGAAIVLLLPGGTCLADEASGLAKARTWIEHAFPSADEFLRAYLETTLQPGRARRCERSAGSTGSGPSGAPATSTGSAPRPCSTASGSRRARCSPTTATGSARRRAVQRRLNDAELDELLRLRDSVVGRRMGDMVAALAIYFSQAHTVLASGRDYEPGRLVPVVNLAVAFALLERSDAETKEITRFYDRPIGKRVRSVDAEAHRHGLTAVLARVEQADGAIAARLAAARPALEAIAADFAAAQR
jgi:hypothetical protein